VSTLATTISPIASARAARERLNRTDRRASRALTWATLSAAVLITAILVGILFKTVDAARPALSHFGLSFITTSSEQISATKGGAAAEIYASLVTSLGALLLGGVLGISIGLYLALMASPRVAAIVGPLVELLAAIPSVVFGLLGFVLIAPFMHSTIEPIVHSVLGWLPIFSSLTPDGFSVFAAIMVLTVMVVPIISALSRDVFRTVPRELRDAAEALGSTRWEVIRGVVLPTTQAGVAAACALGFARAIGEAIAVAVLIGGTPQISSNLFKGGATLASTLAANVGGGASALAQSAYFYMALILLFLVLLTSLFVRWVQSREHQG
jgi:phosphate transport system permease protein